MPKQPPSSTDVIASSNFNQADNPDAIKGVQANESFLLTAKDGQALGSNGETKGFAKYQFDGAAHLEIEARMSNLDQIKSNLGRVLGPLTQAQDDIKRAQDILDTLPTENRTAAQQQEFDDQTAQVTLHTKRYNDAVAAAPKVITQSSAALGLTGEDALHANPDDLNDMIANLQKGVSNLQVQVDKLSPQVTAMNKVAGPAGYLMGNGNEPLSPDRGLLARSVASHQVDQLLKTNVVAEERLATDKNGKTMGVSIQGNGAGVTSDYAQPGEEKKACFLNVDYKHPEIQKGLSDLEVNDYITGQIDRHAGNIYIDPETNKVTGIDNDLAFPEISREEMFEVGGDFTGKAVDGMPSVIHKDTAQKILDTDPAELRKTLEQIKTPDGVGNLGPGAIDGAVERLENLQKAIRENDPSVQVVEKFDDNTYNAAVAKQEKQIQDNPRFEADDVTVNREKSVKAAAPTSYLGAVMKAKETYAIAQQVEPEKFGVRESGPKASRDSTIVNAKAMGMKQDLDGLKADLQRQQAQLEKVKAGGIGGMFSKLRGGDAQKTSEKIQGTIKAIENKEAQLDNLLSKLPKEDRQNLGAQVGRPDPIKAPAPKMPEPKVPFQKPEVPGLDLTGLRKGEAVDKEQTKLKRESTRNELKNIRKERSNKDTSVEVDPQSTRANVKVGDGSGGSKLKKSQGVG